MINQTLSSLNSTLKFPKYLSIIVGIYCFFFILPTILLKRSVVLPYFGVIPISILFTGTYFVLLDVITEVYGYFEGKKALYSGVIAYSLFILIIEGVININQAIPIDHSTSIIDNRAYNVIFNNIYVTWVAVVFCTLIFDIFNIRLMSKWKFLLNGKYFILRSILSSSFSMILFTLVTNFFAFHHKILNGDFNFYLNVNIVSISAKILSLIAFAYPALLLSKYLKKKEQIDIMHNTNIFLFNKVN
jgi:uncharacterized PurR-regulated membrane protein YhhQ (DUF165 family)